MKTNSYIKFTNILDLIQLYLDSLDLPKIGVRGSIFTNMPQNPDAPTVTLSDRENTGNHQLQKHRFVRVAFALQNRRHHSIDWRWQSQLM